MIKMVCLAAGSLAGGFGRYFLASFVQDKSPGGFPLGTLFVNVSGCFLIGIFNCLAERKFLVGPNERLLFVTGFCGAYTTFSTLVLETSNLMKGGQGMLATVNIVASLGLGFALFKLGAFIGTVI